jgi:transposase-like protein
MDSISIKSYFKGLSSGLQEQLLSELTSLRVDSKYNLIDIRERKFNDKQGVCPHCSHIKYTKMGKDKNVQRYKCSGCNRTFTPFTGTWMAQIHKKDKLADYLKLMQEGLSLEKIRKKLEINKKTAFDWRHKITHSLKGLSETEFAGITESDETFFLHSEKGSGKLIRKPRKRGKQIKTKGISKEQVAVIVTADRKKSISLTVAGFGRIRKDDITEAIGNKISKQTILCTDGHSSFKSFTKENNIEHHVLKANAKEFVKQGIYHIQNINSLHGRLKKWINKDMYGVASKYLQNYLFWFKFMEEYKNTDYMKSIVSFGIENTNARAEYLDAVKNVYSKKTTSF